MLKANGNKEGGNSMAYINGKKILFAYKGNSNKKTVSGTHLKITDISPIQHNLGISVTKYNLLPYPFYQVGDKTFTDNGDGTLTINKSSQDIPTNAKFAFSYTLSLPAGIYYFSGFDNSQPNADITVDIYNDDFSFCTSFTNSSPIKFFQLDKYTENITVELNADAATQEIKNYVFNPKITTYGPMPQVASLSKNLLDVSKITSILEEENSSLINNNGVLEVYKYGVITNETLRDIAPYLIHGETYTLSCGNLEDLGLKCIVFVDASPEDANARDWFFNEPKLITEDFLNSRIAFYCKKDSSGNNVKVNYTNLQIEYGSEATEYEPYNVYQTSTPNDDEIVYKLVSQYPQTNLAINTYGVHIICNYMKNPEAEIVAAYESGEKAGYNAGYDVGTVDGQQSEYDRFWDTFQSNGEAKNYNYAFAYSCWNDNNYNPKYPINCNTDNTGGNNIFRNSNITDTKVSVIIPGSGTAAFYQSKLKTIRKLVVTENTSYSNMFYTATELENLTIEGIIAKEMNLGSCRKLTHDSLMSVINHLGTITTALTLTLGDNLAKLTDTEKAIATQKGWTLA